MPHTEPVRDDIIVEKAPRPRPPRIPYTVNSEVKAWIKESIKHHWFLYLCPETRGLRIAFFDSSDAMLWKLVWH